MSDHFLSRDEWQKLRDMINAWPDDSDRIRMHRVINRLLEPVRVEAGTFINDQGREVAAVDKPDSWICRRIADYPPGYLERIAPNIGVAICVCCHAPIVYNRARTMDAEKVCMQCAGIEPLPMTEPP